MPNNSYWFNVPIDGHCCGTISIEGEHRWDKNAPLEHAFGQFRITSVFVPPADRETLTSLSVEKVRFCVQKRLAQDQNLLQRCLDLQESRALRPVKEVQTATSAGADRADCDSDSDDTDDKLLDAIEDWSHNIALKQSYLQQLEHLRAGTILWDGKADGLYSR